MGKIRSANPSSVSSLLKKEGYTKSETYASAIRWMKNRSLGFRVERSRKDETASIVRYVDRWVNDDKSSYHLELYMKTLKPHYNIEVHSDHLVVRMKDETGA